MAKKDEFELDFDDFDDDMDFDFDDSKPLTRIEKVKRVTKGFKGGLLDALKDPHVIAEVLNRSIPSEYGIDAKVAVTAAEDISELMRKAHKEMDKVNNELKQSVADSDEDLRKFLSPKLYNKFKQYADSRERRTSKGPVVSAEDSLIAEHLGDWMERSSAEEDGREHREIQRDIKKVKISTAQHGETIQAVGSMHRELMRQNSFNENVTAKYYRKSLEISVRHLSVAAQTLMLMRENAQVTQDNLASLHKAIVKPDIIKLQEHELTRQRYGGGIGARSVFGGGTGIVERIRTNATKRATEMINSAGQMASMAIGFNPLAMSGGMITPNMLYEEGGQLVGRGAARLGGHLAARQLSKLIGNSERGKRWGGNSRYLTQNFRRILEERHLQNQRDEFSFDEEGNRIKNRTAPIVSLLRDLIGDDRGSRSIDVDNTRTLQEPHPFTKQSNRTLNEVIPGLLSGILSQVTELNTGKPAGELTYDYAESKFVQSKDHGKKVVHEFLRTGDGDLVKDRANKLLDSIDPDGKLDPTTRRKVAEQLLSDNYNNRLASVDRLTQASTFKNLSPEEAARVTAVFGSHFKGDVNNERINAFSEDFNNLLSGSNINRDQVQGLINTGNRRYLEEAGLIKDGVIDQHAIMRAMVSHDYGSVDSSLGRMLDKERKEKEEAEAKAKAKAEAWTNRWNTVKGKFTGKLRDHLGAEDGQSTGAAFRERAEGLRDQAETLYRNSGFSEYVSDLSDEALDLLDQHGIDLSKERLSQKAKSILAKHGLLERAEGLGRRAQQAQVIARRKARRARRSARTGYGTLSSRAKTAYGQVDEYARNFDPKQEQARAASLLKKARENWSENGIRGFIPASAEAIQARVTQAIQDFDPKDVTSEFIERATELSVDAQGQLKDLDVYKRDLVEALQQQRAKINNQVQMQGGYQGITNTLKNRLRDLGLSAKDVGKEKLQDVSVQAEAMGEAVGERFSDVGQEIREAVLEVKETLVKQHEEEKAEREGPRVGSYEDQMSRRKEAKGIVEQAKEKFDKKESGFGLLSMLMGGMGFAKKLLTGFGLAPIVKLLSMVGPAATIIGKSAGLLFTGAKALGPILAKIPGIGKALSAAGGALGVLGKSKTLSTIGRGAMTAGKMALFGPTKGQLWTGAKFAGRAALGTAKVAGKVAMGVGKMLPLLATPAGAAVAAGVLGAAALGYGAYKTYKYFTRVEPTELNNYRMMQYGFERDDGPTLRKIVELENLMIKATTVQGEKAKVDFTKVNWVKATELFDINIYDENTQDGVNFEQWIIRRFNPVFTVWASINKHLTGSLDFEKAEKLKGEDLKTFVDGIKFTGFDYPTDLINPITKEPLTMGARDVRGQYEILKEWSDKKADEKSLLQKAGLGLTAAWKGVGLLNKKAREKFLDVGEGILDKINPGGQIKNALGKARDFIAKNLSPTGILDSIKTGIGTIGDFFVRASGIDKVRRVTRLDGFGAIRMRMYGLIDLDYPKVRALLHLEDYCQEDINYRKKEGVEYEGSVGDVAERFYGRFGITDKKGPEMTEWRIWFNTRFLPVFTNSCAVVYNLTQEKDFAVGTTKLSKTDLLEAAKFIIGTVTKDANGTPSTVWALPNRPWPRDPVNMDPESITPNLRHLEQEAASVKVMEDRVADASGAVGNPGDPSAKPNPMDNGTSFDPNNVKSEYTNGHGKVTSNTYGGVGDMHTGPGVHIGQGTEGKADQISRPVGSGYAAMKGMLEQVAEMVGIDPKLLAAVIAVESGFNPDAVNPMPGQTATGLGQIVEGTWEELIRKYGAKYGLPSTADRKDPVANALMTAEYIKQNLRGIQSSVKGRPLQPLDAYMAHFLGPTGYRRFLEADPNTLGSDVSAKQARANPEIFYHDGRKKRKPRTVGEILAVMGGKLNARAQEFGVVPRGETLNLAMAGNVSSTPHAATQSVLDATGSVPSFLDLGPSSSSSSLGNQALIPPTGPGATVPAPTMPSVSSTPVSLPTGSSSIPNVTGAQQTPQAGPRVASNGIPIVPELSKVKGNAGEALLVREKSTEGGTYGVLTLPDGTKMNTLELPWKDNKPRESCIPPGTYMCKIRQSPKFGTTYEVHGVKGRSAILFHAGNSAGDVSRGMKADSQGCILLGLGRSMRGIQPIITQSRSAVELFMSRLGGRDFRITITGGGSATSYDQAAPAGAPITGPSAQAAIPSTSPFSDTNPFDMVNNTPISSGGQDAQISGMPGYTPEVSRDPYEPIAVPEVANTGTNVMVKQLDIQTQTLGVLQNIHTLVKQFVSGSDGGYKPNAKEQPDSQEARAVQVNEQTSRQVNRTSNTPEPVVPYVRTI